MISEGYCLLVDDVDDTVLEVEVVEAVASLALIYKITLHSCPGMN